MSSTTIENANPTTILGIVTPLASQLIKLKTNVVKANADNPNGAGLAKSFLGGGANPDLKYHQMLQLNQNVNIFHYQK